MKRKKSRKTKKSKRKENKHKPSKLKHLLNKMFTMNSKKILMVLAIWTLFVITHYIISLIFKIEEKIFFVISGIIIPIYLLISIFFFMRIHRKEER